MIGGQSYIILSRGQVEIAEGMKYFKGQLGVWYFRDVFQHSGMKFVFISQKGMKNFLTKIEGVNSILNSFSQRTRHGTQSFKWLDPYLVSHCNMP